jgi:outer membrane lipoprotein-sorting protein
MNLFGQNLRIGRQLRTPVMATALLLCMSQTLVVADASKPAQPDYAPESLISEPSRLDVAQPAEPWRSLLRQLQSKENIWAEFTEHRYLPFKKIPVIFTGEIRLSKERGLSLHYKSPENRTMVVDQQGVLLRDSAGRTRELPADPRAQAATAALLHVMRFDVQQLAQSFAVFASGDRSLWHFGFEPKEEAVAKTLSRLIVTGEGDRVRRIIMRKSALQRVEILIGEVKEGVQFSDAELRQHFR